MNPSFLVAMPLKGTLDKNHFGPQVKPKTFAYYGLGV